MMVTTYLVALLGNSYQDSAVIRPGKEFFPCTAVEKGEPVHTIQPTRPLLFELNYRLMAAKLYELVYGAGSAQADAHAENFACVKEFSLLVEGIVTRFIKKVKDIVNARAKAFLTAVPRDRRDVAKRQFRKWRKRSISRRSPVAWAISLSAAGLLAQVGLQIYFGTKLAGLTRYVSELDQQLQADARLADTIANNVRVVKSEETAIAFRLDAMYFSMKAMKNVHACDALKTVANQQLSSLEVHFQSLYVDMITARITPRILSLESYQ